MRNQYGGKKKAPLIVRLLLGLVVIMIGIAIGIAAIGIGSTSNQEKSSESRSSDAAIADNRQEEDKAIVDGKAITAEFLGYEDHPELGMFVVRLRVTNKTDQPIWVYMDKASVNDEMMQMVMTGMPLYIDPGKRGSNGFIFYYKQTSIEKFEDVNTVSFKLKVDNQDTMKEIWTSPEVTLTK